MEIRFDGRTTFREGALATGFARRLRGLLGRTEVGPEEALVFERCRAVHCRGMRVAIDVVFMDAGRRVLGAVTAPPGSLPTSPEGTRNVLECAAGAAAAKGIHPGQVASWGA